MAKCVEITAVWHGERFRFANGEGDVLIGDVQHVDGQRSDGDKRQMYAVKVEECEKNRLRMHGTYRFYGQWSTYKNKRTGKDEKQFHASVYVNAMPANRAGVIKYLREAGRGNGIGPATAAKIWDKFGPDSVRVLREQPEAVAAAVSGVSEEAAKGIAERLAEQAHIEHCSIELLELLDRRKFPKATAKRCLQLWGNQAAEIIKRNPFILGRFRGCGFRLCDAMYLDLGHEPGRLKRQALCAWYAIAKDTSGHTWYDARVAIQGIRQSIHGAEPRPVEALRLAKRAGALEVERTHKGRLVESGGNVWIAEGGKAKNERFIARHLADALEEQHRWPDVSQVFGLSDHQRENLARALQGVIAIFGGSPGTGKTHTAAGLVKLLLKKGWNVAVCAPTGKAAVRVSEAMNANGVDLRAKTIHSLLGVESATDGWRFKHGEHRPLPNDVVVVDEKSMVDCDLESSLLAARSRGTHMLFVGDVNQLPPVGHGAPLRDMIQAGVPYGELREIMRNDGGIVQACADIRDGRRFTCGGNLVHVEARTPEEQIAAVLQLCEQAKADGLDPTWDLQIIVPVNKVSTVSRKPMNDVLQAELNANPGVKNSPFRTGDKIVNTKNGYYTAVEVDDAAADELNINEKGDVYVANGELGMVIEATPSYTVCKIASPDRAIRIPRGSQNKGEGDKEDDSTPTTGCSWDLGYALSIHKSQGSEWPRVAVVLDEHPGAKMVFSREAVYTAISRAKQQCYLVGQLDVAYRFCRRKQINERKTFLVERFHKEVSGRLLAEM